MDNVELELRHARLLGVLHETVLLLRKKDHQLLHLYYYKDRSMEEIASETHIASAGAAKKAKCLAQKKLREIIVQHWNEEGGCGHRRPDHCSQERFHS